MARKAKTEPIDVEALLDSLERREKPPLSRMSTSAGLTEAPLTNPSGDGLGVGALAGGGFAHLARELVQVRRRCVERILALELGTKRDLQEFRGGESASLQLVVQIIRQVHL